MVGIQITAWNLPEFGERIADEFLFGCKGLVGVVVEQVIVAFDAVVNRVRGMKVEIFFEVTGAEFAEFSQWISALVAASPGQLTFVPDPARRRIEVRRA